MELDGEFVVETNFLKGGCALGLIWLAQPCSFNG
jgi:hypothetical protein